MTETNSAWKDKYRRVYSETSILKTKIDVHAAYSTIPTDIVSALYSEIGAPNDLAVLDVGCGTGQSA